MSSMFRSPNDVTSSDPESSSDEEISVVPEVKRPPLDETRGAEAVEPGDNTPVSQEYHTQVPNLDTDGHSNFILSSLLEEYCLNRASQILNRPREDPEVQTLGKTLYSGLSNQLSDYGLVGQGYDGEDAAQFRQGYLQGLDHMVLKTIQENVADKDSLPIGLDSHVPLSADGPSHIIRALPEPPPMPAAPEDCTEESLHMGLIGANVNLIHALGSTATASKTVQKPMTIQSFHSPFVFASRYSNDFTELRLLGKGGFGKVYGVANLLDGQEYAIKKITLSPRRLSQLQNGGSAKLEALLREIRTLARLEHPNVVRYYSGWIEYTGTNPAIQTHKALRSQLKVLSNQPAIANDDDGIKMPFEDRSDVPSEGKEEDGIIFDYSSESIDRDLQRSALGSRERRISHATTSSTHTKKSFVNSFDEDQVDADVAQHGRDISILESSSPLDETSDESLSGMGLMRKSRVRSDSIESVGPTLFIQMSLHPTSLSQYLSPDEREPDGCGSATWRHCFHLEPSLRLMLAVLSGVEYLHSQNLVHRDLKPSNIFLTICQGPPYPAGSVAVSSCTECDHNGDEQVHVVPKIGDFGLVMDTARLEGIGPKSERKGSDGTGFVESLPASLSSAPLQSPLKLRPVGTELYRPPNVSSFPNEKYDVFALGVIAVEMVCRFNTKMERHSTLSNLQRGIVPLNLQAHAGSRIGRLGECIKIMVCTDESKRYDCKKVRGCLEDLLGSGTD